MESWLLDTALFESLVPVGPHTDSVRQWIETHEDPVFVSAASIRKIETAIERIQAGQGERVHALTKWLDALVTNFSDKSIRSTAKSTRVRAKLCAIGNRFVFAFDTMTYCLSRRRRSMAMAC